jgi:succinate-semialdehyde dehydrogenase / glutarate-semialdehyde dehydrogenase
VTALAAPADVVGRVPAGLLVGGEWRAAAAGATMPVHDPATGGLLAAVADATPADGLAALDAAAAAQRAWSRTPARERAELLRAAFEAVQQARDDLATLITLEMGKPLAEARAEVDYGAEFLRWFSEEAVRTRGDYRAAPDGGSRILVQRQPVGPCLLITPWNFPLAMATRKLAAAFAAGCTAILKPAPQTPLTALAFAGILHDLGLPAGVLGVVTTSDAPALCDRLILDGRVRKVSFTGSTAVGRRLLERCGRQVVRTSMELGGNAPFLVFADADLDAAVDGAMLAKMRNMGEACTAANRFFVEAPVAQRFAELLAERMGALQLGHGLEPGTEVGPLIDAAARERVAGLVGEAVAGGARILTGGTPCGDAGWFYAPTVVDRVDARARLLREELFGPVAPIVPFGDESEAVRLANDTEYGLVAYAYTRDVDRALRLGDELDAGMVALNRGLVSNAAAPFGGIKHSGLGREGGREGIDDYLDVKYLCFDR